MTGPQFEMKQIISSSRVQLDNPGRCCSSEPNGPRKTAHSQEVVLKTGPATPSDSGSPKWTSFVPLTEHNKLFLNCNFGATSIGPIADWGPSLRLYVSMVFSDSRGAGVYWGTDRVCFYNEKFAPCLGAMHPFLMGQGFKAAFPEVSDTFETIFHKATTTGQSVDVDNIQLFVERNGYLEETFFVGQYIPLRGDRGQIEGFYNTVFESTQQRLSERWRKVIDSIAVIPNLSVDETLIAVMAALKSNPEDISLAVLYAFEASATKDDDELFLRASIGVPDEHPCFPSQLRCATSLAGISSFYYQVMTAGKPCALNTTDPRCQDFLEGLDWAGFGDQPGEIVICPLLISGQFLGIYVQGTNPRRRYDDVVHKRILELTGQITVKWLNALASEKSLAREQTLESKLTESDRKLRHMARHAPMGMCQIGLDETITWANQQFFEITGLDPANPNLASFRELLAPEERDWNADLAQKLLNGAPRVTREIRLNRAWIPPLDKTEPKQDVPRSSAWIQAICFPVIEREQVSMLMGYVTDISHQKWAENAQARNAEAAILARRQQEEFIDVTSHEMRNPLSAITQLADGIARSLEGRQDYDDNFWQNVAQDSAAAASTILTCAAHQKRVIDDVLMLSRLDSNLLSVRPTPCRVDEVITRTIRMFSAKDAGAAMEITVACEDPGGLQHPECMVDALRLTQILVNLVSNATKCTASQRRRKIRILYGQRKEPPDQLPTRYGDLAMLPSVETELYNKTTPNFTDDSERLFLYFSVEDNGSGLSADQMKKLFLRFSQVRVKTQEDYGSSGLGLYISRNLAMRQGGKVGVASQPGHGSIFAFYIETRPSKTSVEPLHQVLQSPSTNSEDTQRLRLGQRSRMPRMTSIKPGHSTTPEMEASGITLSHAASRKPNVLMVEDNLINQKVLAKQLRQAQISVVVANHGKEALEVLARTTSWGFNPRKCMNRDHGTHADTSLDFDIVLMDMEMPVMDGLECTKRIRLFESECRVIKRLPIVAVTANVRTEQEEKAFAAGVDAFFSKPFVVSDLLAKINELIM